MVIHNQFLIELARNKRGAYIVLVYNGKKFLDLYLFRMYSIMLGVEVLYFLENIYL